MLEVLRQDYVRTARAKGLVERIVIFKHALRNALIPVITIIGSQLTFLLGGLVIIEVVFSLPGVGTLGFEAIQVRDYPVVQGVVFLHRDPVHHLEPAGRPVVRDHRPADPVLHRPARN